MSALREYEFTVPCKGCQNEIHMKFIGEKKFCERSFPCFCNKCKSALNIEVRQGDMDKRILVRCQMVKHSKKLETILKIRGIKEKTIKGISAVFGVKNAENSSKQ